VNHLEAMSQWATFSKMRVAFHLYVPLGCVDSARRLCTDLQITVAEVWAYHVVGDQIRFTLVQRVPQASDGKRVASPAAASPKPASAAPRPRPATPAAARPARRAAPAAAARRKPAAAKAKAPAPRHAAAKTPRKAARPSRSQKRR
jgi:hypothetical protein